MTNTMTPKEIVAELDRFIVGQTEAKKAVAIALRNRWRRMQAPAGLREEIVPKNILMIGPTGCGKTEIARRLAKLAKAPFLKVEATKFTEVGYVGRDVDSILRDLVDAAIHMVREEQFASVRERAEAAAENRVLDALVGASATEETRRKFRERLRLGELNDREIELELAEGGSSFFQSMDVPGGQVGMLNLSDMIGRAMGGRTKTKRLSVEASHEILVKEESEKLIDQEAIAAEARRRAENDGIVFIDEIDKIAARAEFRGGGDVSREGVQRDLLPLLEGTTVSTKHGPVKTDHILFIASGAFHMAKPSDLLPELQGRMPIRVSLNPLTQADLERILREPEASLVKQYAALMEAEKVTLNFAEDGIIALAAIASEVNASVENIGARRLHTVMEKLLEEVSFDAPEREGETVTVDAAYVRERLSEVSKNQDLSRFIL